jgi:hypothetical protein
MNWVVKTSSADPYNDILQKAQNKYCSYMKCKQISIFAFWLKTEKNQIRQDLLS